MPFDHNATGLHRVHAQPPVRGVQASFEELGTPLREATFCVVDLETTGGSPQAGSEITEVGAVKVRGGERLAEFQTLVRPSAAIPAFISVLTGITDTMVADAPTISAVLPAFFEFAHGCVLVAHNAPFDLGFLREAAHQLSRPWPNFEVVDTARLARRILTRDETPNCKLATLARHFRSGVTPEHRALGDAQATVDVLHGLLERVGSLGVDTLEELATLSTAASAQQRAKRHLADHLPHAPGVYLFRDERDEVLYVGTSKDLRSRVRSYFTGSQTRSRIGEMVGLADRVEGIVCATPLEAEVRELRLIAAHKPRYNRRSRYPERQTWAKLTVEPFPRLSLVRDVRQDGSAYLGPFSSRRVAEEAVAALHEAFPIRQCTRRMTRVPDGKSCMLADIGRCLAPCLGEVDEHAYAIRAEDVRQAMQSDPRPVIEAVEPQIRSLARAERFEDAATARDRLAAFVRAAARSQRLSALAGCAEIVAARRIGTDVQRDAAGGWQVHVIRYGRLAAAGEAPPGTPPMPMISSLQQDAETVRAPVLPAPAATVEEAERILAWLEQPGTRLVHVDGTWACPTIGAGAHARWWTAADSARYTPTDTHRRHLPTQHRPPR